MPVNDDTFRRALGHFASGVTAVTSSDGSEKIGLTVSAFCSVSLNPPYVLVCIDKRSSSIDFIRSTKAFAVNILAEEQIDVSNRFASRVDDKFSGIPHHIGGYGQPILDSTLGFLECSVVQDVDAGDHIIFVGEVESADVDDTKRPLLYYHGQYGKIAQP